MQLTIHHTTQYQYQTAPKHLIQVLRLTPRDEPQQRMIDWRITSPGKQTTFIDAYGNISHSHVVHQPQTTLSICVQGTVEITPLIDGVLPKETATSSVPEIAYLVPTDLTRGFGAIDQLAQACLPQGLHTAQDALLLATAIGQAVSYAPGNTDASSTAQQAFLLAQGVCQDHAHIMIAACRHLNIPARYVSGYVDPGNSRAAASHAWVDLWINDHWLSVDVTNQLLVADVHCRLAIGRDYLDASPIRGVREGGHIEHLDVSVTVNAQQ